MEKINSKRLKIKNRLRRNDLKILFDKVPEKYFENVLELGAGDGFQSTILRKYCKHLVCTEIDKNKLKKRSFNNVEYKICDAQDLSVFDNDSFALIFSSNLLEHIKNKDQALQEMKRVLLREEGIMIHTIPNRLWKVLSFIGYYLILITRIFRYIKSKRGCSKIRKITFNDSKPKQIEEEKIKIKSLLIPKPHGVDKNNSRDFINFGKKNWVKLFNKNGLRVIKVVKLSLSSGHRFGFDNLRIFGQKMGLCSSYGYTITSIQNGGKLHAVKRGSVLTTKG